MYSEPVFLKRNIQVEPLLDQWYAWPHLIPPATAARNLVERHFKIMDSYIASPQIHAAAVKNPRMAGGPFIDYDGKRVQEIRALRTRLASERKCLVELANALSSLDELLRSAIGFSLEPLYSKVPDLLRGYVELTYDLNNNCSYRLLEPLLYRSTYFIKSAQSVMVSATKGDYRSFVLSTPRLEDDESIHLKTTFDSPGLDELFQMTNKSRPLGQILERLEVPKQKHQLFSSFFTTDAPVPYWKYSGAGVRWRYFGHACVLVEAAGVSVLTDPVISYSYDSDLPRYTYEDLPDVIDFAVVTHNHQDHILFETLLQLRHRIRHVIVPKSGGGALQDPSVKLILENSGFRNIIELAEFESVSEQSVSITALPFLGEHADLDIRSKAAYMVKVGRHRLLFLADSCNIEPRLYEHIVGEIGPVDALFLGMECDGAPLSWLYGPLLSRKLDRRMDESRRLSGSNFQQASDIVQRFQPKDVYVYAMGQEPWLSHIMGLKYTAESRPITESNRLIVDCRARAIVAERLFGEKEILIEN